ncbi:type IV toxin-antitoxin system AbiEi family antitoxin domain-containing protein [Agromyces sp. NPDC049794]|uniref:type IV toxin-antitoxin system AbiEi family antitoxin domain-containing protein n=1 Tax=unclassified Agromyces TaxID=2639701 RepID=UPI0033FBFBBA
MSESDASNPTPAELTMRHGGVLRASGLMSTGLTEAQIRNAVRLGGLIRIRRGWYGVPPVDAQVVRAVRVGGSLTAGSVAAARGLWLLHDSRLHVRVPATAARLRSPDEAGTRLDREAHGVCVHYRDASRDTDLGDRLGQDGLPRSIAEMFRCVGTVPAMIALESALNRGVLPMQALESIRKLAPDWVRFELAHVSPLSDSGLETIARLLFHRVRVSVRAQVLIEGVRHVDLLVGDRLIVELDGRAFHSDEYFERDRTQDLELAMRGYLVVRLSYRMLTAEWDDTHRRLLELVRRGLHRWGRAARELPAFEASQLEPHSS